MAQGGRWPPHCVPGTPGAEFAKKLRLPPETEVISKASRADVYSDFQETGFAVQLHNRGIVRLFVGGLATDYCVRATVEDAIEEGFSVVLLADAVRAVNVQPHDGEMALRAMEEEGAILIGEGVRR